jgi:hypothetical protein
MKSTIVISEKHLMLMVLVCSRCLVSLLIGIVSVQAGGKLVWQAGNVYKFKKYWDWWTKLRSIWFRTSPWYHWHMLARSACRYCLMGWKFFLLLDLLKI